MSALAVAKIGACLLEATAPYSGRGPVNGIGFIDIQPRISFAAKPSGTTKPTTWNGAVQVEGNADKSGIAGRMTITLTDGKVVSVLSEWPNAAAQIVKLYTGFRSLPDGKVSFRTEETINLRYTSDEPKTGTLSPTQIRKLDGGVAGCVAGAVQQALKPVP